MKKLVLILSFFVCAGCFAAPTSFETEATATELSQLRQHFIYLFEELDILISYMHSGDELDSVFDILEISNEEAEHMLQQLSALETATKQLQQQKRELEKLLIHFQNAVQLQMIGIENGNSATFHEGFLQFEQLRPIIMKLDK